MVGASFIVLGGSTGIALTFRERGGMPYRLSDEFTVGGEAAVDIGPLIAPVRYPLGSVTVVEPGGSLANAVRDDDVVVLRRPAPTLAASRSARRACDG